MPQSGRPRQGSISGAIFLIGLGVFLLVLKLRPDVDFWPVLWRYWPLILIFIGVGKILDSLIASRDPQHAGERWFSGVSVALLVLIGLFVFAVYTGRTEKHAERTESRTVELQNAKTVDATVDMRAGTLDLSGGSSRLLDADFKYNDDGGGAPAVDYTVDNGEGSLHVSQGESHHLHFATTHDDWNLRFNNDVPMTLKINMGAGQSNLRLNGMDVTRLDLNLGAGELNADLTGKRKEDLEAYVNGGVGSAVIHLPRDIGVEVHASGGIGSISRGDLRQDGDAYVNEAYGKSKTSIRLTVKGGIGEISLREEP
jgi:hypothetical protein